MLRALHSVVDRGIVAVEHHARRGNEGNVPGRCCQSSSNVGEHEDTVAHQLYALLPVIEKLPILMVWRSLDQVRVSAIGVDKRGQRPKNEGAISQQREGTSASSALKLSPTRPKPRRGDVTLSIQSLARVARAWRQLHRELGLPIAPCGAPDFKVGGKDGPLSAPQCASIDESPRWK